MRDSSRFLEKALALFILALDFEAVISGLMQWKHVLGILDDMEAAQVGAFESCAAC